MRQYPTMSFRNYIRKFASETKEGKFFCKLCNNWVNKQRWIHFKLLHRFRKEVKCSKSCEITGKCLPDEDKCPK